MKTRFKKTVIKIIPDVLWDVYRWYTYNRGSSRVKPDEHAQANVFTSIYENNYWNDKESLSGTGSNVEQTKVIRNELAHLIKRYKISSMLDIPCGDFHWMQYVDLSGVQYTGADIVPNMIRDNTSRYQTDGISFRVLDLVNDDLPKVDMIFCRDCLVHLSYDQISKAIVNIRNSGSKYLLTTSFIHRTFNFNIQAGNWRPLNLKKKPFNFPDPVEVISEQCTEGNGKSYDKALVLYVIEDLKNLKSNQ